MHCAISFNDSALVEHLGCLLHGAWSVFSRSALVFDAPGDDFGVRRLFFGVLFPRRRSSRSVSAAEMRFCALVKHLCCLLDGV